MAGIDFIHQNGVDYEIVPEIAPRFKTTINYAAGDCVIYNAEAYRFKTAHSAGAWIGTDAEKFLVGEELGAIKEDLNAEQAGVIFPTLTSSDFTQGYWAEGQIVVTNSRICSKKMYNVNEGDALVIDQGDVQVGAWLYENGDLTSTAINLLAYTDAKPSVYIIPYTGTLLFNAKKASGNIAPSDFTGSITSYKKNSIDIIHLQQDISFGERPVEYAVSSTYPLGYRNGYFSPTNGHSDATSTYSRTIAPLNVNTGDAVTVTPADGYYVSVVAFSAAPSFSDEADNSAIFLWSSTGHYTPYTFIAKAGELYFLHTKVPASQRIEANLPTVAKSSQIIWTINQLETAVTELKESTAVAGTAELYLGTMVQAYMTENGIVEHTTRICMKNALALPHGDRTVLKFSMNEGYKCVIRTGATPYNLNHNGYWYADGSEFSVPSGDKHYRIAIAKTNHESDIALDEYESINLHIYYEDDKTDFSAFDSAANAVMLYGPNGTGNMIYRSLPTFVHTSDVHGDYTRVKRFNEFAERLGVTMACITGDMVGYNINTDSNHFEWLHEIIKGSKVKYGICVGNHDSHVGQGTGSYTMADADLYPIFYDPIKTELGHTTEKLWYYTDLTAEKIRIISLDLYQAGGVWTYTYFSQEQLTWLCDTLAETPTGYGVIILMHAQQLSVIKDADHTKFYQAKRKGDPPEEYNAVDNDGDPIGDIVDAFIRRTTISAEYTQNSGAETLTVSGDFTAVDSSTEFICYMTGHFHQDTIGYNSILEGEGDNRINVLREPKQLILNVTCGCAVYGNGNYKYLADCSDIPRNNCDATQDAFNVYGIDRLHKTVRVARVGSNLNWALEPRDYMIIPYT